MCISLAAPIARRIRRNMGSAPPPPRGGRRLSPVEDMLCGAFSGGTTRMCVAPLDVIKIRFQVASETGGLYSYTSMKHAAGSILRLEGPAAFWKGNVPALLMVVPYYALQFGLFYQLRQSSLLPGWSPQPRDLCLGGSAGAAAALLTYPLDVVRTQIAAEPTRFAGMREVARGVYARRGVRGLFQGIQPRLVEIVPFISLQYATYEQGRRIIGRWRDDGGELGTVDSLAVGACAGTFARFVTLPLDNVKKRMQVAGQFAGGGEHYSRPLKVLADVWRADGVRGLFRGTIPGLVKAAPNSAIGFASYEAAKRFFETRTAVESKMEAGNDDG